MLRYSCVLLFGNRRNLPSDGSVNLSGNEDVTDVCLPTVGKMMLNLVFLALCHTRVTIKGLVWLRQLPVLKTIGLCGFDTSDASVSGWKALQTWCDEQDCPRRLKSC